MLKKFFPVLIVFIFLTTCQICCGKRDLTQQEKNLFEQLNSGNRETNNLLIEKSTQADARVTGGNKPLFSAVMGGNFEATRALLDKGATVNVRDDSNNTPLHFAVMENNMAPVATIESRIELIQLLLVRGADVNALNKNQYTPLHNAVAWGWFKQPPPTQEAPKYRTAYKTIIQMLLEHGADPNIEDRYKRNALKLAEGEPEIIELLVKYGAKE